MSIPTHTVDGNYIPAPAAEVLHNSAYTDVSMIWGCCGMEALGMLINNMFGADPVVPRENWVTATQVCLVQTQWCHVRTGSLLLRYVWCSGAT